jgi:addiction module HigA family antidote
LNGGLKNKTNDMSVELKSSFEGCFYKILSMKISKSPFSSETHPGEFIREEFLQASGKSIFQFALEMEISEKLACEIIVGIQTITPLIAEKLARVFGIKSQYWLDMQTNFDAKKI